MSNGILKKKGLKLPNAGDTKYLPFEVDFQTCRVISRSGRDTVAAEPIQDGLRIVFDDWPPGADDYDIVIQLFGYPPRSTGGSAASGRPAAHQSEAALLASQNSALQKLVESQRAELATDAKTIAQLRRKGEVAANPPVGTESKATAQAVLDVSGTGTRTTEKFTVAGDWDLNWSYDCTKAMAAVGGQGNFQVFIYDADGTLSFENVGVNQLGNADSGVEHYHNGGTYYLVVNSVGSWKVGAKESGK